jgi:ribosome-binding factor A
MVRSYPRTRPLDETVKEAIARILESEVGDPRLEFVTVTGVTVTSDLRHADVFVTAHGGADRYESMLQGLGAARARIRRLLAASVRMKYVPELHFKLDESIDTGETMDKALRAEARAERRLARRREAAGVEAHEGDEPVADAAAVIAESEAGPQA